MNVFNIRASNITISAVEQLMRDVYFTKVENGIKITIPTETADQIHGIVDTISNVCGYTGQDLSDEELKLAHSFAQNFTKASLHGVVIDGKLMPLPKEEYEAILDNIKADEVSYKHFAKVTAALVTMIGKMVAEQPSFEVGESDMNAYGKPNPIVEAEAECDVATHTSAKLVIDRLRANGGRYIDDHNRRSEVSVAQMYGLLESGDKLYAFIGYTNSPFCINRCYIGDDNMVHLSTWSVAGNVRIDQFPGDVGAAIQHYNANANTGWNANRNQKIISWMLNN